MEQESEKEEKTVVITQKYLESMKKDALIRLCLSAINCLGELQTENSKLHSEIDYLMAELDSMGKDITVLKENLKLQLEANFNRGSEKMPASFELPAALVSHPAEDREESKPSDAPQKPDHHAPSQAAGNSDAKTKPAEKQAKKEDRLGNIDCETIVSECRFDEEWLAQHPNARKISPTEFEEYVMEGHLVRYVYKVDRVEMVGETDEDGNPVIINAGSKKPLVRGCKMSSLFVCKAMYSKYELGMPYNRQSYEELLEGNEISRQNIDHWTQYAWTAYFCFIYILLGKNIKKLHILHMDETNLPVKELKKVQKSKTGWVIEARSGKYERMQIVFYRFRKSREQNFMQALLDMENSVYVIHSDGYAAYINWDNVINVFCHDHNRRMFVRAMKVEAGFEEYRKRAGKKDNQAAVTEWLNKPGNENLKTIVEILTLYKTLYMNERVYKEEKLNPDQIRERRQKESKPVLDQIYEKIDAFFLLKKKPKKRKREKDEAYQARAAQWSKEIEDAKAAGKVLIQEGKLEDAVVYATDPVKRKGLYLYLEDGRYQISNISAETGMKTWGRLKKSSGGTDTVNGAVIAAGMNSIIKTAELNHLNPEKYLVYVMEQMKAVRKEGKAYDEEFLEKLMPYSKELPEYLYVGKKQQSSQEPKVRNNDILFFNGADPVPVAIRNPKEEEYYQQLSSQYPGDYEYRQIRMLKRRKERQEEHTCDANYPPVFEEIPERLCS